MKKLVKKIKKYTLEITILFLAFLIAIVSLIIFINSTNQQSDEIITTNEKISENQLPTNIFVDVSGSVNKPDLYQVKYGTRLKDLIKKAGDLSETADKGFFARNFNLARIVNDQEKIYIPSIWEVQNGYFLETPQSFDYLSPSNLQSPTTNNQSSTNNLQSLININNATIEELDSLPGIGKITSQKIINNRPYKSIEELLNKKVVNKSVFEKIKNLITI